MFLFLKLLLAHLVADFILQFEEVYQLKLRSVAGHLLHGLIHAALYLLFLFPYLRMPSAWLLVLGFPAVHFVQDRIKYSLQDRYPRWFFVFFSLDQLLHVAFLASVFLLPIGREVRGFDRLPALNIYYLSNSFTLVLVALVMVTFAGAYILHAFRRTYVRDTRPAHYITGPELVHGIAERLAIAWFFLFPPTAVSAAAALAAGLLRLPFPLLRNRFDFALNFLYAAGVACLFRRWIFG